MLNKLREIDNRFTELEDMLQSPEVYSDPERYAKLAREQKELRPLSEAYRRMVSLQNELSSAKELLSDPELGEMARAVITESKAKLEETETEIKLLLLPKDPNDSKNVIMEIRQGIGGEEAALFAADIFRMYSMYCDQRGWSIELVNENPTELGGFKEISFIIKGEGAWSRLKYEAGGHCVKRVPVTESNGRIQTSTATVAVLPEAEEVDFHLDLDEVQIDTFRSSGAGGQKVNKTSSAIRVTHVPTGTVVECQDERSQYRNKDKALDILRSKLYEAELEKRRSAVAGERKSQVGTGERSEKIRTYFYQRDSVVDRRLSGDDKSFPLRKVLDGGLDELIDALITADRAEKLRSGNED